MQYAHWLMVAGAVLVVLGFVIRSRLTEGPEELHRPKAKGKL